MATGEAPWLATIVGAGGSTRCGGALVAPDRVLTAAHCVEGLAPKEVRLVLGDGPVRGAPRLRARGLSSHARYVRVPSPNAPEVAQAEGTRYDAALVLLARPASAPALPVAAAVPADGAAGTLYGRGLTETGNDPVRPLALGLVVLPGSECASAYGRLFHDPSLLCVLDRSRPPEFPCNGDSGAPYVVDGAVAGLVAWGNETKLRGCGEGGDPETFTDVAALRAFATAADPVIAPIPRARPRVVHRGRALGCAKGRWGGDPARLRARLQRAGGQVSCRVTATNAGGTVARRSPFVRG